MAWKGTRTQTTDPQGVLTRPWHSWSPTATVLGAEAPLVPPHCLLLSKSQCLVDGQGGQWSREGLQVKSTRILSSCPTDDMGSRQPAKHLAVPLGNWREKILSTGPPWWRSG